MFLLFIVCFIGGSGCFNLAMLSNIHSPTRVAESLFHITDAPCCVESVLQKASTLTRSANTAKHTSTLTRSTTYLLDGPCSTEKYIDAGVLKYSLLMPRGPFRLYLTLRLRILRILRVRIRLFPCCTPLWAYGPWSSGLCGA